MQRCNGSFRKVRYHNNNPVYKNDHGAIIYYESNTNNVTRDFNDGENLITDSNISFDNTFISEGEGFARTIPTDACSIGSAMGLNEGVYYIRGYFVNVNTETIILDQYTNTPSYRVGLDVIEEVINADIDPTINDNANGFNNFAAPGADRLKITAELAKKPLDIPPIDVKNP